MRGLLRFPLEALIWISGLILLVVYSPAEGNHFTICPLYNLGFEHCPGCGLGRSISLFFRGDIIESFQAHPLGIIAVIILTYRIIELTKKHLNQHGQNR
jgi:hypothetical protein